MVACLGSRFVVRDEMTPWTVKDPAKDLPLLVQVSSRMQTPLG